MSVEKSPRSPRAPVGVRRRRRRRRRASSSRDARRSRGFFNRHRPTDPNGERDTPPRGPRRRSAAASARRKRADERVGVVGRARTRGRDGRARNPRDARREGRRSDARASTIRDDARRGPHERRRSRRRDAKTSRRAASERAEAEFAVVAVVLRRGVAGELRGAGRGGVRGANATERLGRQQRLECRLETGNG